MYIYKVECVYVSASIILFNNNKKEITCTERHRWLHGRLGRERVANHHQTEELCRRTWIGGQSHPKHTHDLNTQHNQHVHVSCLRPDWHGSRWRWRCRRPKRLCCRPDASFRSKPREPRRQRGPADDRGRGVKLASREQAGVRTYVMVPRPGTPALFRRLGAHECTIWRV